VPSGRAVIIYVAKVPEPEEENPVPAAQTPAPVAEVPTAIAAPPAYPANESAAPTRQASEIPTWDPNAAASAPANQTPAAAQTPPPAATQTTAPAQTPQLAPASAKVAKIRYQIPPLARPLSLKILMNDLSGMKILRERQVNGGEYLSMDAPYSGNATVTVLLGDRQVWEEKYN
jgi:serine/threonine-protein kinase